MQDNEKKLTLLSQCTSGGCGAKIGPGTLETILAGLAVKTDPNLLVGFGGRDDAAVYRISETSALVSTVDFFSPMIDDPFLFGKIAAANALSDIYAMGGTPLFALNLVCFPEKLDTAVLGRILAGGGEKVLEAGAVIAGGHSIFDHEPKYGLAVTGTIHPQRILRNDTGKTGDALILTKAVGVGLIMSALRAGEARAEEVTAAAASMERLNRYAAEKFVLAGDYIHACTDVTGFGIAVHGAEMAGTAHTIVIDCASLPLLPGALYYAEQYFATAAGQRNRNYMKGTIDIRSITTPMQEIIFDPQTSGGLLIAVAAEAAQELCDALRKDDPHAAIIGEVTDRETAAVLAV